MPKTVARNYQCLMIEADDRRYFTHEEHMPQLLEFCKSFDMNMSVVKVEGAPILDITDLPKAVCDAKKTPKAEFNVVRKILPFDPAICIPLVRTRSQILETAKAVREKIHDKFAKGEAVSRDMLIEEFPDASITAATFMQHVRLARKELEEKGYQFERISPGCYRAITPAQQKVMEDEKTAITLNTPIWTKFKKAIPTPAQTPLNYYIPPQVTMVNPYQAAPLYELGKKTPYFLKDPDVVPTLEYIDGPTPEIPDVIKITDVHEEGHQKIQGSLRRE
jgi:hypothetical protein